MKKCTCMNQWNCDFCKEQSTASLTGSITLFFIIIPLIVWCLSMIFFRESNCKYESVASYYPAYAAGCELFRGRFVEPEEPKEVLNLGVRNLTSVCVAPSYSGWVITLRECVTR